jgi:hypothetical protein
MMSCELTRAILRGDREQDLSPAESADLEAHLASCAACARELEAAEVMVRALAAPVPAHDWSRVDAGLVAGLEAARPGGEDPFESAPAIVTPIAVVASVARPAAPIIIKDASWRFRSRSRGPGALLVIAAAAAVLAAIGLLGQGSPPEPRTKATPGPGYVTTVEERIDPATGKKFPIIIVSEKPWVPGPEDAPDDGGGK